MSAYDDGWGEPAGDLQLSERDVHIWRINLAQSASFVRRMRAILSCDERERADRFHFARDRDHYTVGRGLLRSLLGRYLEQDPRDLEFAYNDYGKPALRCADDQVALEFNLSHSHGLALLAMARRRLVGVDVERIRGDVKFEQIAERFFSAQERTTLRTVAAEDKPAAFFNCWTRKEAYIKARGEGLSFPLDQFDVSLAPGLPAMLLAVRGDEDEVERWTLQALKPGSGYAGAVAVQGDGWALQTIQWLPDLPEVGA